MGIFSGPQSSILAHLIMEEACAAPVGCLGSFKDRFRVYRCYRLTKLGLDYQAFQFLEAKKFKIVQFTHTTLWCKDKNQPLT